MRQKAPTVEMTPNLDKIVEAILHIVTVAGERNRIATQYDIVKSIFLADRASLNTFGRPITFDVYYAMKHGPVPSVAYDFLKRNPNVLARYSKDLPWDRVATNGPTFHYRNPKRVVDEEILAPSDLDALSDAFSTVKTLGFPQIRKLTHDDPAYIDAWEEEGPENSSYKMSYGMLFDAPNMDKAKELAFLSKHI